MVAICRIAGIHEVFPASRMIRRCPEHLQLQILVRFNAKVSIEADENLQLEVLRTTTDHPAGWEHLVNARDSTDSNHPNIHIVDLDRLESGQKVILEIAARSRVYLPVSRLAVTAA